MENRFLPDVTTNTKSLICPPVQSRDSGLQRVVPAVSPATDIHSDFSGNGGESPPA
jgi:hypothetical protein